MHRKVSQYLQETKYKGVWLAQSVEHGTLELRVMSSSPHWAWRLLKKNRIKFDLKKKERERETKYIQSNSYKTNLKQDLSVNCQVECPIGNVSISSFFPSLLSL